MLAVTELETALKALSGETGWECWQGVIPVLYARLPKSSPPLVVRAPDVDGLREAIKRAEEGKARL
jgi:hypothetical protein